MSTYYFTLCFLFSAFVSWVNAVGSVAEIFKPYMDLSASPADNLNQYANGHFARHHPLSKGQYEKTALSILQEQTHYQLIQLLQDRSVHSNAYPPDSVDAKLGRFWSVAKNGQNLLPQLEPLFAEIDEIENFQQFQRVLAHLHQLKIGALFQLNVEFDKNSNKAVLIMTPSAEVIAEDTYDEAFKHDLLDKEQKVHIKSKMRAIDHAFKKSQALFVMLRTEWDEYFRHMKGSTMTLNKHALMPFYGYLLSLASRIPKYLPIYKTYLKLDVIQTMQHLLNSDKALVMVLTEALPEMLSYLYCEGYGSLEKKMRIQAMISNISAAYEDRLSNVKWMSSSTKKKVIERMKTLKFQIGCPDSFSELEKVEFLRTGSFVDYFIEMREAEYISRSERTTRPPLRPFQPMAMYSSASHTIVFTAGILQAPFFNASASVAEQFGALGTMIAHEMTHGISLDTKGVHYLGKGKTEDLWEPEDRERFRQLSFPVNGQLTLGENLADIGGLIVAFQALQLHYKANEREAIDEDGLTPEQIFFLAYAQTHAVNILRKYQVALLSSETHSPAPIRVNGAVAHVNEFADHFKVDKKNRMYLSPRQRVNLWRRRRN